MMKWLYKLSGGVRALVAVAAWAPFVILAALSYDIPQIPSIIAWPSFLFLVSAVVFDVLAAYAAVKNIVARKRAAAQNPKFTKDETPKAPPKEPPAPNTETDAAAANTQTNAAPTVAESAKTDGAAAKADGSGVRACGGFELPARTKVVGVTFENRQTLLSRSRGGDAVTVEHKPTAEYPEAAEVISGVFYKTLGYIKKE
ncbi:MAG: hypothetical protein LBP26_04880, partial [Clostridiales bacterium]|nr:hypothetical protein [Clostridiales bacterium]